MMRDSGGVVCVDGVVKDYRPGFGIRKRRALHGISFSVHEGEIFGFVGPNGAGKTTTLKILMGLIRPTEGRASILGHDVSETEFRRHVGFLPENPYFYDYLTGREILNFYGRLSGVPSCDSAARIAQLLDWVGLREAADARLRVYSKGMLQRVGIAQALVHDPKVIFLDEPMSGLDPLGRKEIRDLILRLRAEGKTVFMNSHILSDVESVCDRVAIIADGRIRYQGSVSDCFGNEMDHVDIILTDVAPEAMARIEESLEVRVAGLGDRIEFRVTDKDVNALLALAVRYEARVVSVSPRRVSLEQFFLSTVQGEAVSEMES
ncbi:MAG: ABC transporter ATP-binding protein [Myxococcota bacterium]